MKTITIITIGLLQFFSCKGVDKNNKTIDGAIKPGLSEKVYSLSENIDSMTCKSIPDNSAYYSQTLLFINDSVFVEIDRVGPTTDTMNYAFEYYTKGIYKLGKKMLKLEYNSKSIVLYTKGTLRNKSENWQPTVTHIETENSDRKVEQLERLNCKDIPYFQEPPEEGAVPTYFSQSKNSATVDIYKTDLEKRGIWKKLFGSVN